MNISRQKQLIAGWEAVTKEDVKKMASEITLEIVYLLSGKEAVKMKKIQFENLQETLYNETLDNGLGCLYFTETRIFKNICDIYNEIWFN